jgi:hypothetical protein
MDDLLNYEVNHITRNKVTSIAEQNLSFVFYTS